MEKHQAVTSGIKHWGLGGYASVLPRIRFVVTRQESSPQSPTFHTANRWHTLEETDLDMRRLTLLTLTILISACQADLKVKESEKAYKKGIETLETLSEDGDPDYRKAQKHFARATHLNPENITAQYWKADAELKLGKFAESLETSLTALDKVEFEHPLRPHFLVIAGISTKKMGQIPVEYFNKAISIYETRIEDDINNIDAIMNKAIVLCYMDKKESAIAFLNTLSLNEESQAILDQMKVDIKTFDADKALNQLQIEK